MKKFNNSGKYSDRNNDLNCKDHQQLLTESETDYDDFDFQVKKENSFSTFNVTKETANITCETKTEIDDHRVSYSLPKRVGQKRIFEEFLTIGIENNGLELIEDMEDMLLTPKILSNYPNNLLEHELQFNIKFLKNFCFHEGVKVRRFYVSNEDDYMQEVLEKNFFSKTKFSFCLVQQITPEEIQKYFIYGVRFDDLYINNSKQYPNSKNIFVYEKTLLFISYKPLCKLFELIFQYILNIKKMHFFGYLDCFSNLFIKSNLTNFTIANNEKTSEGIIEVLQYFFNRSYPRFEEYIGYKSQLNELIINYKYPNQSNEIFLAAEYLSKIFFQMVNAEVFINIIIRILLEQSFLVISDHIQSLTSLVLGFSYFIQPFKWPFILIPNLPLDLLNMVESPVPYMIGLLGDSKLSEMFIRSGNANLIYYTSETKLRFVEREKIPCTEPYLNNLKTKLAQNISMAQYYLSIKMLDEYENYCERIYKKLYETLKSELADVIDSLCKSEINLLRTEQGDINNKRYERGSLSVNREIRKKFSEAIDERNKSFGIQFAQTQIFICYLDDIQKTENE